MVPTGWRVYVTAMWTLTTRLLREQWGPWREGTAGPGAPGRVSVPCPRQVLFS